MQPETTKPVDMFKDYEDLKAQEEENRRKREEEEKKRKKEEEQRRKKEENKKKKSSWWSKTLDDLSGELFDDDKM